MSELDKPDDTIRCDACPVLCRIRPGKSGACDRYANDHGTLVRVDPLVLLRRAKQTVAFLPNGRPVWDGSILPTANAENPDDALIVTGIGSTTTYPDYKPAPFIVSAPALGVDMITVVTEGIFSYCGLKLKIDTDRYLGPEQAAIRVDGEQVGHVTTAEYGSQMLSLGGVRHLTGGSKREGTVTCETLLTLANKGAVELEIEGGERVTVQAGRAPIVDGAAERVMRVGCGSATIGIFAKQWQGLVDEVIVVDDHITGVLTEHQAGRFLDFREAGVRVRGRRSTPGRYFQVAQPGSGWGGTDVRDPLSIIDSINPKLAWPGMRLLFVSTTGEHSAYFELDHALTPRPQPTPPALQLVNERIAENCEPSLCTVLFMGGAGGSLRAGVTENPIHLTRSVKALFTRVTVGGAPAYVWPGGGITVLADVAQMPDRSFGYVPTPALVAPIEFTMRATDYAAMGGHLGAVRTLQDVLASAQHLRFAD
jgi:6-hydroxynicotinate reductase